MNATDRSIFRRHALFAARSVTFALALGACESSRNVQKNDEGDTANETDTTVADSDEPQETDTLASTDETDAVVPTDETDAIVETQDTDDTVPTSEPDCVNNQLDIVACCDARQAWCGVGFAADTEAYNECVFGPGFDGSTGCIPWGPPVPPSARAVA